MGYLARTLQCFAEQKPLISERARETVARQLAIERISRDAQRARDDAHVPTRGPKRGQDPLAFVGFESVARARLDRGRAADAKIEIFSANLRTRGEHERAREHVLELAHVAGKGVRRQPPQRILSELERFLAGVF